MVDDIIFEGLIIIIFISAVILLLSYTNIPDKTITNSRIYEDGWHTGYMDCVEYFNLTSEKIEKININKIKLIEENHKK